jgi:hypothetical protein
MNDKRHDRNLTVTHPDWCDRDRCTAASPTTMGGAHRGTPTKYAADGSPGRLEITANLYQAHAPWLTALYVDLELSGLEHDWTPVNGAAHLTPDQALELGRFLTDLGQTAVTDYAAQVEACLSALSKGVSE